MIANDTISYIIFGAVTIIAFGVLYYYGWKK